MPFDLQQLRIQEREDDLDFIDDGDETSEDVTSDSDGNIVEKEEQKKKKKAENGEEDQAEDDADSGRETPLELRNNDWWTKPECLKVRSLIFG